MENGYGEITSARDVPGPCRYLDYPVMPNRKGTGYLHEDQGTSQRAKHGRDRGTPHVLDERRRENGEIPLLPLPVRAFKEQALLRRVAPGSSVRGPGSRDHDKEEMRAGPGRYLTSHNDLTIQRQWVRSYLWNSSFTRISGWWYRSLRTVFLSYWIA